MNDVDPDQPTARVVDQRVRNRIIEYLELAASYEAQQAYQRGAPVNVAYQVINWWMDWTSSDPRQWSEYEAVYSASEYRAMCDFQTAWEAAATALPDDYPTITEAQALPEWDEIRRSASKAGRTFADRGKLPEDVEFYD